MMGAESQQDKNKLSHEIFKNKLNSEEATPIRMLIRDFYNDFEQKSSSVFASPDEQSQYLRDFLNNLLRIIIENPLWSNADIVEQENTIIETEKLITKKFLDITFGPSEDIAKDSLISHRILMHSWVEPRHFDLPAFDFKIFENAGNELCKMNQYKFYIDKIICIVNCLKLIEYAYHKNISNEELTSDNLMGLLIFVILKTNPNRLYSNVKYIIRYINQSLLSVEIYKLSLEMIWQSITFIEKISQTDLTITPEEYEDKINEITWISNEAFELTQNQELFGEIARGNSTDSLIQSLLRFKFTNEVEGDIPCQDLFTHLESIRSNSINRNGSSLSSNSIMINEHRKELREYYMNHMNDPMTNPFSANLSEDERRVLSNVDQGLKASLSIGSNKEFNI